MKTKVVILFCLFVISCRVFAYTKQDIIDYAASQEVCDSKTSAIFNTYRNTFTRLIKQKKLTEEQCNQIMNYLTNSVGILNKKGVCKLSDLNKLTTTERNTVYNNLSTGANIIIKAPTEGFEESNDTSGNSKNENTETNFDKQEGTSGININKTDGTIDIYENGILLDKVELTEQKLTYTGPSMTNIYIICLLFVFLISLATYIILYKKHSRQLRFVKNILMSFQIMSFVIVIGIVVVKPQINTIGNVIEMFNLKTTDNQKEIVVTQDKNIIYPSYGYVYGSLSCDKLNVNVDVAFGDSSDILKKYAGTASWSSLPTEGKNIVISAHNSKEMFGNIENIKLGDELILDTEYAKCIYKVYDTQVIKDTDVDKVKVSKGEETLVIYTCFPFSQYIYSNERFVVYSELKSIEWK